MVIERDLKGRIIKAAGPKKQFCSKGHDTFITGRDKKGACKECKKEWDIQHRVDKKEYFQINKEKFARQRKEKYEINRDEILKKQAEYYEENRDIILVRVHDYQIENKELILLKHKEYYELNKEEILIKQREYNKAHPEVHALANIKCETNRNLRVIVWTDTIKIKDIYKNKPLGMTVDHIIPLQGKKVSGLHVSWNLQYLTLSENSKKHNKVNLIEISNWYGKLLEQAGLK